VSDLVIKYNHFFLLICYYYIILITFIKELLSTVLSSGNTVSNKSIVYINETKLEHVV
jgi:uncharacterized membrane protein (DUF485 family)